MNWNHAKLPLAVGTLLFVGLLVMAMDHRAEAVPEGASIIGIVKFDGPKPQRPPLVLKEKGKRVSDCAKLHKTPPLSESMLVNDDGELANVFVYIRKGLDKKEYPMPKGPAVLDQDRCTFRPRVQGVRVGQEFVMRNSDPLVHNVRSYSFRNRAFNVAQPAKSADRKKVFTRVEREMQLGCDIHNWMKAYIFVLDHPFFAVTDAKGKFKIEGLPPGEYTLAAWHEEFGEQRTELKVGASGSVEAGFTFKPKVD